jgi:hypothetical protein
MAGYRVGYSRSPSDIGYVVVYFSETNIAVNALDSVNPARGAI